MKLSSRKVRNSLLEKLITYARKLRNLLLEKLEFLLFINTFCIHWPLIKRFSMHGSIISDTTPHFSRFPPLNLNYLFIYHTRFYLIIFIPLKILRLVVVGRSPPLHPSRCFFLSLNVLLDTLASTASGIRKTADWRTQIPTRTVNVKQEALRKYKIIASDTLAYAYTHTYKTDK